MLLSPAVRAYVHAHHLAAVWIGGDGKAWTGSFPARNPVALAWTARAGARKLARWINKQDRPVGLSRAAQACRVRLMPHAVLVRRAESAARTIKHALDIARRTGALEPINAAYEVQRALALAAGKRAPTYGQAMARVRKALYAHAAAGKALPAIDELLRMIIGPGPSRRSP